MPKKTTGTTGAVQLHGHTVHHKHGIDVFVAATEDGAKRDLYNYVKEWWGDLDREDEDGEPIPCPEDMDEAIDQYFDSENGAYEEYAEECDPTFDPTEGMDVFIRSDRFKQGYTLNIRFTDEGLILDYVSKKGRIVKTTSMMYDEIVDNLLK